MARASRTDGDELDRRVLWQALENLVVSFRRTLIHNEDGRATILAGSRSSLAEVFRVLAYTPQAPLPVHA